MLLYRKRDGALEVLLVHPGGPLWARRDAGAWSVPKGEYDASEDALAWITGTPFRPSFGGGQAGGKL
jgi:predicted NUDIX family NTP pyrophosphohydrolase